MKASPQKKADKPAPQPAKPEESAQPKAPTFTMPSFTNAKKKEAKESFSPLKETYQDRIPSGELVAAPRKDQAREFQVAGQEPKPHKEKHYKEEGKKLKEGQEPHEGKEKGEKWTTDKPKAPKEHKKIHKKEKVETKKEEGKKEKKAPKVGDKVASFSTVAPPGVRKVN